jgi:hypothetical protein
LAHLHNTLQTSVMGKRTNRHRQHHRGPY